MQNTDHIGNMKHLHRMQGQGPYLHTVSICPLFNSVCEQNPVLLRTLYGVKVILFFNAHNEQDNTFTTLYSPVDFCNSFTKL